jgi:hypothetical protein
MLGLFGVLLKTLEASGIFLSQPIQQRWPCPAGVISPSRLPFGVYALR